MINVEKVKPSGLFTNYIYKAIPLAFDESMSYYETLCGLLSYLKDTILPVLNNNADAIIELQSLMAQLQSYVDNYFDNLDVQSEINNKLDEMVEDGTFDEIINQEIFSNLNNQISNLQTQTGTLSQNISEINTNLNDNIARTTNNTLSINDLQNSKASNNDLLTLTNNVNNSLNTQFEILSRLQGGTPSVVTSTSDMTDTSKIYVLTTDGNWYYYDGASWVVGGIYQATEFADDSIESNSIESLNYDKVKCTSIFDSLIATSWGSGGSVTYNGGNSIQLTKSTTQDGGFYLYDLSTIDTSRNLFLYMEGTGIRYNIYLFSGSSFNKTLYQAKDESINYNTYCKIKASDLAGVSNPKIVIVSPAQGTLYLNNITLNYYDNYNFINTQLNSEIENIKPYYENVKENTMMTNILDWTQQSFGGGLTMYAQSPRDMFLNFTGTQGSSRGISSPLFTDTSKKLIIECDYQNKTQSSPNFTFYIAKNSTTYVGIGSHQNLDENNHLKIIVDLPYYNIYENYDSFYIWLMSSQPGIFNITNLKIYLSDIAETSIYSQNFNDMVKKIDSKLNNVSFVTNYLFLNSASNKYYLQANDSGHLQLIDVIPNKTLYIGNSLLLGNHHDSYAFGMCATNINGDYYAKVNSYILSKNANATFEKISGTAFESCTTQTQVDNFFTSLSQYMSNQLDLVIVQLGDNVNTSDKINMFSSSCIQLLQYIKNNCPNARVVFVGEWFSNATRQNIISDACKNTGCQFVDISDLYNAENKASIGTVITYPDSYTETVTSEGVASHPSDTGFTAIANRIIEQIF